MCMLFIYSFIYLFIFIIYIYIYTHIHSIYICTYIHIHYIYIYTHNLCMYDMYDIPWKKSVECAQPLGFPCWTSSAWRPRRGRSRATCGMARLQENQLQKRKKWFKQQKVGFHAWTLAGWWFQPLCKILVKGKDYPIYCGQWNMFQTTNQLGLTCKSLDITINNWDLTGNIGFHEHIWI